MAGMKHTGVGKDKLWVGSKTGWWWRQLGAGLSHLKSWHEISD